MNRNLGTPVHFSNLVPGQTYYLRTHWGEGAVRYEGEDDNQLPCQRTQVTIVEGGFRPPLRRYKKGDTMHIDPEIGGWYEIK